MPGPLWRSLRPRQWVKNLFVLAPVVFAHAATDPVALGRAVLAFSLFCAASSAVYLLNDLRDREADRHHPGKRDRPIARGDLSIGVATAAAVALGLGSLAGSATLGPPFFAVLLGYLGVNLAYSFGLKHVVILDVMLVSIGFVLRVEGGAAAVGVTVSSWILLCTIFLALFLAFSKRRHELELLVADASRQRRVLEEYGAPFLDMMINVVTASAVVSYALFATAPESVAKHGRGLLLTIPFVLFGIFRYLFLVYQRPGEVTPTEALVADRPFVANLILWGATILVILYVA